MHDHEVMDTKDMPRPIEEMALFAVEPASDVAARKPVEFVEPLAGPVRYAVHGSPLGDLLLTSDGRSLTGLYMLPDHRYRPSVRPDWIKDGGETLSAASTQLDAYFAGDIREFTLPLAPSGSAFQLAVWRVLTTIAYGTTTSYGAVAAALGKSPAASRAVGMANGHNPISLVVPCHRVIGSNKSLTGYGGGLARKEYLLRLEKGALDRRR